MQKLLIYLGVAILVIGIFWPWVSKLPFGRLPGDIVYKGENTQFYFPITTMIIVSLILTFLFQLFKK